MEASNIFFSLFFFELKLRILRKANNKKKKEKTGLGSLKSRGIVKIKQQNKKSA
jgi:hypothetical protein